MEQPFCPHCGGYHARGACSSMILPATPDREDGDQTWVVAIRD